MGGRTRPCDPPWRNGSGARRRARRPAVSDDRVRGTGPATTPPGSTGVALVRGKPGVPHAEEVKRVCFYVFCGAAGRSPTRTEHLAARQLVPLGYPVPVASTIAAWAREEDW